MAGVTRVVVVAVVLVAGLGACAAPGRDADDPDDGRPTRGRRDRASAQTGRDESAETDFGRALAAGAVASLDAAVEATLAIERGRLKLVHRAARPGFPGPGSSEGGLDLMTMRAAFDRPARRLSVDLMPGDIVATAYRAAAGRGDDDNDEEAGDTAGLDAVPIRVIVDGDTTYTRFGVAAEAYGVDSERWYRGSLAAARSVDPDNSVVATLEEPLGIVRALLAADHVAVVAAGERVRGVPTTRLSTNLTLATADEFLPEATVGAPRPRGRSAGPLRPAVDVWVDGAGRIRRLEAVLDLDVGEAPGRLVTTLEVFDVGEPVELELPSPGQVVDGFVVGGGWQTPAHDRQ